MNKKYKAFIEVDLEVETPNKKQRNSLINDFKDSGKWSYESFGSTGRIKIINVDIKDVCESR